MLQTVNRMWKMIKTSTREIETEGSLEETVTALCSHISEYHNMSMFYFPASALIITLCNNT